MKTEREIESLIPDTKNFIEILNFSFTSKGGAQHCQQRRDYTLPIPSLLSTNLSLLTLFSSPESFIPVVEGSPPFLLRVGVAFGGVVDGVSRALAFFFFMAVGTDLLVARRNFSALKEEKRVCLRIRSSSGCVCEALRGRLDALALRLADDFLNFSHSLLSRNFDLTTAFIFFAFSRSFLRCVREFCITFFSTSSILPSRSSFCSFATFSLRVMYSAGAPPEGWSPGSRWDTGFRLGMCCNVD